MKITSTMKHPWCRADLRPARPGTRLLCLALVAGGVCLASAPLTAATFHAPQVPHDASPVYTTADAQLTLRSYADSNATVVANFGQSGDWLGVVGGNASAIDGTESVTLEFTADSGLLRLGHRWTRARVTISGFVSDPGFTDPQGHATSVSYAGGTLNYFYDWDAGAEYHFTFQDPSASAGQVLRINVHDTVTNWQATVTQVEYVSNGAIPAVADLVSVQQTMDHFSASDAWSMQNVGLWTETNRTTIANLLFTTNNGIGLSAWRFNLAAGFDSTVSSGLWQRWRTEDGFLVSSNNYDWTRQPGQRWFLSAAKERSVDQFIAMVYSPPTNFTRNAHVYCSDGLGSSNLKPGYEPAFAQYIGDVLGHFATNPVTSEQVVFDYVMPVNEPFYEWNSTSQEGCRHANADIIAQAQALRSALDARGLGTDIVLAEAGTLPSLYQTQSSISSKYGKTYGNYLSAFNDITNILSRNISAHSYWTDNPATQLVSVRQALKAQFDANPHWRYWQTEYCMLEWDRDLTMATALNVARVIWADLAVANASAWHWWLSLSQADYKDGLLYTDYWQPGDAETLYCSKNFWAFGQWTRFIRLGWKRVDLPGFSDVYGLMSAAFVDPATNALAMVFVNQSGTNQMVAPSVDNLPPGKAIACWSPWITSPAPSDNLSPLPPLAPDAAAFIPSNAVMTFVAMLADVATAPPPVITSIPDQTVTTGQVASVVASVTTSNTPGNLVDLTAWSDNPAFLPASAISIEAMFAVGTLTREVFTNFSGTGLSFVAAAPSFPNAPANFGVIESFEAPQNVGTKYGTRLRGFVVPPQTGDYTFWIASRDASELYLSTNADPARKTRIAWVTNATDLRDWTAEPNQQSTPITLEAGRRYYIEAVHTAASGADHLSVGWQLPDASLERPIPGMRLSPWTDPLTNATQRRITMEIPANASGNATVFVAAADSLGKSVTNQFSITVATNPPINLNPTNLTASVSGTNLTLSWPESHTGWLLQSQTNSLNIGLTTNWVGVPGSSATNVWVTPLQSDNDAVFYRLLLP